MSRPNVIMGRLLFCTVMLVSVFGAGQESSSQTARKVISRVVPVYPALARTMNVKGIVRLEVVVVSNGTVKSVKTIGGHPVLVQAAERAVLKWKWEHAERESNEVIELRFNPD